MIFALRASGLRWLFPVHFATATLGALAATVTIALPSATGVTGVPVALILSLGECALISMVANAAWPDDRLVPVRSSGGVLVAVLAVLISPSLVSLVCLDVAGVGSGRSYFGALTWLLALQLFVGVFFSSAHQAVAPAVYVLLCALLGRSGDALQPWAWPLASPTGWAPLTIGSIALTLALGCTGRWGLRRPRG